jgi:hypothetical protein
MHIAGCADSPPDRRRILGELELWKGGASDTYERPELGSCLYLSYAAYRAA